MLNSDDLSSSEYSLKKNLMTQLMIADCDCVLFLLSYYIAFFISKLIFVSYRFMQPETPTYPFHPT